MRRTFFLAACMTLCACVIVRGADAVVRGIERAVDWLLGAMSPQAPTLALGGSLEPVSGPTFFADPHVARHEARMSRRAAMRGI